MTNENNGYPDRAKDVLVTQNMLYGVRDELKAFTRSEIRKLSSRISGQDAKFATLDSKIDTLDSKFEGMQSQIHRLAVLMEEQNAKNNVVLDGLAILFGRQERVETKLEEVQRHIDGSK